MCGICGVISKTFQSPELNIFKLLLMFSHLRGTDSTGIIKVTSDKDKFSTDFGKSLLPSLAVVYGKENALHKKFLNSLDTSTNGMIGHARSATIGQITEKNAHPFDFDYVIGVHNGTIRKTFKDSYKYPTDSEGLYSLINDQGIEKALNEVADFNTAYALAWFDKYQNKFMFVRNKERPLYFSYVYGTSTLMFASEKWMLQSISERMKLSLGTHTLLGEEKGTIFTLEENQLFIVDPDDPGKYEIQKLTVKIPKSTYKSEYYSNYQTPKNSFGNLDSEDLDEDLNAPFQYNKNDLFNRNNNNNNHNNNNRHDVNAKSNLPVNVLPKNGPLNQRSNLSLAQNRRLSKKERKILNNSNAWVNWYNDELVTWEDAKVVIDKGCSLCNKTILIKSIVDKKVGFIDESNVVCPECKETDLFKDYLAIEKQVNKEISKDFEPVCN